MVSFSSGELSGDVSNKRPLTNVYMHKYKPRKVCSVRDFPSRCGRAGIQIKIETEENGTEDGGTTMCNLLDEVEGSILVQNSCMKVENSVLDEGAEVDEVLFPGCAQSSSSGSSMEADTFIRPKISYQRRRVACVRDFPPHCGRHPPLLTEEQKEMVTSANDCLVSAEKVKAGSESTMLRSGSSVFVENEDPGAFDELMSESTHVSMSKAFHEDSDGDSEGPTRETNEMRPSQCALSSTGEVETEIVHGLIAAPYCPWTNLHGVMYREKMPKQNISRLRKPESVARKSVPKGKFLGPTLKQKKVPILNNRSRAPLFTYVEGYGGDMTTDSSARYPSGVHSSLACMSESTPVSVSKEFLDYCDEDSEGTKGETNKMRPSQCALSSRGEVERDIVHGLMAAPYCPWKTNYSDGGRHHKKMPEQNIARGKKPEVFARKNIPKVKNLGPSLKQKEVPGLINMSNASMFADEEGCGGDMPASSSASHKPQDLDARLPPFGPKNRSHGDVRNRVRETLRLFHTLCRKLLQEEEAGSKPGEEGKLKKSGRKIRRIDLHSAKIIKDKEKEVNTGRRILGEVPGVEVGDEFQYRVELCLVGIHCHPQGGIEWMQIDGKPIATSIVASGSYSDDMELADVLIYSGQGGNVVGRSGNPNQPEDQKLEKGNLALKNSIDEGTPVRVTRGWKETKVVNLRDSRPMIVTTYIYDGLYTVTRFWEETGPPPHGKRVYMFELIRNPCQPKLAWKELKMASKSKTRPGLCATDISGRKELFPIAAFNTLDNEKPPRFSYISRMTYPEWYHPSTPVGCDCKGRCGDSRTCQCAIRNGGEIPYTHNGAIVQIKPLVYECGPSCKCPPSCYNRVTQHGIRYKLEIFNTGSRGWGVRSPSSIPSGSFICEYVGEVLEEKEAEKRVGSDEYLFDIGKIYMDSSVRLDEESVDVSEEDGYTIDAAKFGNLGRFINHSCSPNVYAQNVIHDNGDRKMPHVMLFALENIPPLLELTYNYNYKLDQIRDAHGNIKIKNCYCGSAKCTGRLY